MKLEQEYLNMINDTVKLVEKEKSSKLSEAAVAFESSKNLVNDVEFWKWMGNNYPKDLSSANLIQQAANTKGHWLNTQIQGKGYEWDYMNLQRSNPSKLFSKFEAGNCPTQVGIDITETNIFDNSVVAKYQNKAYLSNNNPNLHNTPKDAIVVTNSEKVFYAEKQGYQVNEYMNADEIQKIRDSRFEQARVGKANPNYTFKNVANISTRAGIFSAVIGMTIETVQSYRAWKSGHLTNEQYLKEIAKAGADSGITGATTAALMVPVQASIVAAGASTLVGIPVAILLSSAINSVVAPCFGRGKYRQILNEAKYYQALEDVYDDFIIAVEKSSKLYEEYINYMYLQKQQYNHMKQTSEYLNSSLKDLYDSI